jgi:hypothetical protein
MVSWWWVLVAFWAGTCIGVLLASLAMVSRRSEEKRARAERSFRQHGAVNH